MQNRALIEKVAAREGIDPDEVILNDNDVRDEEFEKLPVFHAQEEFLLKDLKLRGFNFLGNMFGIKSYTEMTLTPKEVFEDIRVFDGVVLDMRVDDFKSTPLTHVSSMLRKYDLKVKRNHVLNLGCFELVLYRKDIEFRRLAVSDEIKSQLMSPLVLPPMTPESMITERIDRSIRRIATVNLDRANSMATILCDTALATAVSFSAAQQKNAVANMLFQNAPASESCMAIEYRKLTSRRISNINLTYPYVSPNGIPNTRGIQLPFVWGRLSKRSIPTLASMILRPNLEQSVGALVTIHQLFVILMVFVPLLNNSLGKTCIPCQPIQIQH
jgi:hypothetical protein